MSFTEEKEDGKIRYKITEDLSIYEAAVLRETLLSCLGSEGEVMLDLTGVTGCDAAGMQLLCAFQKSAARLEKPIRMIGLSPSMLDALAAAGFDSNEFM
jgi:anti-anti-sigma regulatory factor